MPWRLSWHFLRVPRGCRQWRVCVRLRGPGRPTVHAVRGTHCNIMCALCSALRVALLVSQHCQGANGKVVCMGSLPRLHSVVLPGTMDTAAAFAEGTASNSVGCNVIIYIQHPHSVP